MSQKLLDKGASMEEMLRNYFLASGYYVVRSLKLKYQGFDVTDIDLFLYMRSSSVERSRINVDIKNKKTPQAMERILWTKGAMDILDFDKCIVATTDKRKEVSSLGTIHNVTVLDGHFLQRLKQGELNQDRLSEEDFLELLDPERLGKLSGGLLEKYQTGKSRLLLEPSFSTCNAFLNDIHQVIEQCVIDHVGRSQATRLLYVLTSFFLLSLDYTLKDLMLVDYNERESLISDGFTYGSIGRSGSKSLLAQTSSLIEAYLPEGSMLSAQLRVSVENAYKSVNSRVLAEYFSNPDLTRPLFTIAKKFEASAFSKSLISPGELPQQLIGILGVILDFYDMDRVKLLRKY